MNKAKICSPQGNTAVIVNLLAVGAAVTAALLPEEALNAKEYAASLGMALTSAVVLGVWSVVLALRGLRHDTRRKVAEVLLFVGACEACGTVCWVTGPNYFFRKSSDVISVLAVILPGVNPHENVAIHTDCLIELTEHGATYEIDSGQHNPEIDRSQSDSLFVISAS